MTKKEKRTLKDGVKNLIGRYKVLEHGIIGVLENNILSFIDFMQEEPSKFDNAIQEGDNIVYNEDLGCRVNLSQLKRVAKKEEPASEPNEQLAETYLAIFDKKFPILPTLKGKQLADYKNFLNKCQQIFGLKEWGIHPIQSKLFEKLTILWATWGAEHLQGVGRQDEKEQDIPVSEGLKENTPWLTPDQARKAVEIAREEIIEKIVRHIIFNTRTVHYNNYDTREFNKSSLNDIINDLKQAIKDE